MSYNDRIQEKYFLCIGIDYNSVFKTSQQLILMVWQYSYAQGTRVILIVALSGNNSVPNNGKESKS